VDEVRKSQICQGEMHTNIFFKENQTLKERNQLPVTTKAFKF
jgi:hypothetical protein